jgi:hypothetical protein
MREVVRNAGVFGGVIALAGGAVLATSSIVGLVYERDSLRHQVGALSRRTAPPGAPTPAAPASASPTPTSRPGSSPPDVVVVQRFIRITHPQPAPSPSPALHPSPRPSPSPPPAACPVAQVVTVRLPVGVLPCGAVQVAHTATIGGTRR